MIDFKDDEPGPGHYDAHFLRRNNTRGRYQFFGSTAERFPEMETTEIGPTTYQTEMKKVPYKPKNHSVIK